MWGVTRTIDVHVIMSEPARTRRCRESREAAWLCRHTHITATK